MFLITSTILTLFLAVDSPPELPSVTTEILSTRYRLHRQFVEKTESFLWLLDTQYSTPTDTVHPLDLPESKTVQLNSAGSLVISRPSLNRLAVTESTLYLGSKKAWLSSLAQFSLVNPEKCRRLVSFSILVPNLFLF